MFVNKSCMIWIWGNIFVSKKASLSGPKLQHLLIRWHMMLRSAHTSNIHIKIQKHSYVNNPNFLFSNQGLQDPNHFSETQKFSQVITSMQQKNAVDSSIQCMVALLTGKKLYATNAWHCLVDDLPLALTEPLINPNVLLHLCVYPSVYESDVILNNCRRTFCKGTKRVQTHFDILQIDILRRHSNFHRVIDDAFYRNVVSC